MRVRVRRGAGRSRRSANAHVATAKLRLRPALAFELGVLVEKRPQAAALVAETRGTIRADTDGLRGQARVRPTWMKESNLALQGRPATSLNRDYRHVLGKDVLSVIEEISMMAAHLLQRSSRPATECQRRAAGHSGIRLEVSSLAG